MSWNVDSMHGQSLTEGLSPEHYARKVAQRFANRLGEPVYLYEPGDDSEPEEFTPDDSGQGPEGGFPGHDDDA